MLWRREVVSFPFNSQMQTISDSQDVHGFMHFSVISVSFQCHVSLICRSQMFSNNCFRPLPWLKQWFYLRWVRWNLMRLYSFFNTTTPPTAESLSFPDQIGWKLVTKASSRWSLSSSETLSFNIIYFSELKNSYKIHKWIALCSY